MTLRLGYLEGNTFDMGKALKHAPLVHYYSPSMRGSLGGQPRSIIGPTSCRRLLEMVATVLYATTRLVGLFLSEDHFHICVAKKGDINALSPRVGPLGHLVSKG
jgi:hypothetical protein